MAANIEFLKRQIGLSTDRYVSTHEGKPVIKEDIEHHRFTDDRIVKNLSPEDVKTLELIKTLEHILYAQLEKELVAQTEQLNRQQASLEQELAAVKARQVDLVA